MPGLINLTKEEKVIIFEDMESPLDNQGKDMKITQQGRDFTKDGDMGLRDREESPEGEIQDANKNKEGGPTTAFMIQHREGGAADVATTGPVVISGSLLRVMGGKSPCLVDLIPPARGCRVCQPPSQYS